MFSRSFLCGAMLGGDARRGRTAGEAARTARPIGAAKAKAGQTADAQVKLALWCEAHGLTAERTRHLALAILSDPTNAARSRAAGAGSPTRESGSGPTS